MRVTIVQPGPMKKYLGAIAAQFKKASGFLCVVAMRYEVDEDGDPILGNNGRQKTTTQEKWYRPGDDLEPIAKWMRQKNRDRFNIYASWSLFSTQARKKEVMIASAAFVADWDDGPPNEVDDIEPSIIVRTSVGRYQWVFIHEPIDLETADKGYKRAARAFGCDIGPSGDPVHLWRVAGSQNWPRADKKRDPSPTMWDGTVGKRVAFSELAALSPPDRVRPSTGDVDEWPEHRVGKPLKRWVKEALAEEAVAGERSEKFHRIVVAIAESGWGTAEIVSYLEKADWAIEKYGQRLEREVLRSVSKALDDGKISLPRARISEGGLKAVEYTPDFKERKISWLWKPYFPRGEVVLVDGDGGVGKTTMMLRVAYDAMVGGEMPNDYEMRGNSRVAYVSLEADAAGVTMPILKRMGLGKHRGFFHITEIFDLDEEGVEALKDFVTENKIDLVVIDSLVDYLPEDADINDYKQASKMGLHLRELIAQPCNCTVVLMRHLTKGSKDKMRYRGMGSQGWHKGARSQLIVTESEEEEDCVVVVQTKSTYAPRGPSMIFGFKEVDGRGVIEWLGLSDEDERSVTAQQGGKKDEKKGDKEGAIAWLREHLDDGKPRWSNDIYEEAEKRGFNKKAILRAAQELNVKMGEKVKMPGGASGTRTSWSL